MHVFGILIIIQRYKHEESVAKSSVRQLESYELSELFPE